MAAINAPPVVSQMEINSGDVFDERSILPKREGLYGYFRLSISRIMDVQDGHGSPKGTRVKTKRLLKKMSSGMHLKKLIFSLQARILGVTRSQGRPALVRVTINDYTPCIPGSRLELPVPISLSS